MDRSHLDPSGGDIGIETKPSPESEEGNARAPCLGRTRCGIREGFTIGGVEPAKQLRETPSELLGGVE